ncbi:RAxF-45 family protein [Lederbergia sp. NSJ-179]|nr:RAxF-45 family protein [Lederbergia sp. NSJ-179]
MLKEAVFVHGFMIDFLYFCRAKFAVLLATGYVCPFLATE